MSADSSPRHGGFPHDPHCLNRGSQTPPSQTLRPPLPQRSNQTFPSRSHAISTDEEPHNEEATYDVLSSHGRVSCNNDKDGDWYDSPQKVYDIMSSGASSSNISSSPLESTISTTSLWIVLSEDIYSSSLSSELRLSSSNPPCEISSSDYACLRSGQDDLTTRTVSLNLSVLVEQVLFVEVAGKVWVAGWSEASDRQLGQLFSFGDELIEVENIPIQGFSCIPQMFYTLSTPGTPVNLVLRPIPFGLTFRLMKPIAKNKEIGIRLHKNKNRVCVVFVRVCCD
ncbi:hypothetical protein COOONC_01094 [Cooperia oncophora]